MQAGAGLSVNETAFFAEVPRSRVEKAVEGGIARARRAGSGARPPLSLPVAAVAFFRAMERSGASALPAATRRAAWARIVSDGSSPLSLGEGLVLDVPALSGDALRRAAAYAEARAAHIVSDPAVLGGTPTIRGTRLSVHGIKARMDGGESLDELCADYPGVPREAFEAARVFASANPPRGRPKGRPWRRAPAA